MHKLSVGLLILSLSAVVGCGQALSPASYSVSATPSTTQSRALNLTWDAVANAESYNIYFSTQSGVTTANGSKISGITTTSYTHTGLMGGVKYYYIVTAMIPSTGGTSVTSARPTSTESAASGEFSATAPFVWNTSTADNSDDTGKNSYLVLTSSNEAHVGYFSVASGRAKYTYNVGTSGAAWTTPSFVGNATATSGPLATHLRLFGGIGAAYPSGGSAALDVAYVSKGSGQGIIQRFSASQSGWVDALNNNLISNSATGVSITSGTSRIYVSANIDGTIFYMTNSPSGTWSAEVVDSSAGTGSTTAIALDANDNPYLVYYHGTNGDLKMANKTGSSWAISTLDSQGDTGKSPSVSMGTNVLHIAYYGSNGTLRYIRQAGITIVDTVDTGITAGSDTAIALDERGNVHLAYFDTATKSVKYATNVSGGWKVSSAVTASTSVADSDASLAVGADGKVRFTHYTDSALKYTEEK